MIQFLREELCFSVEVFSGSGDGAGAGRGSGADFCSESGELLFSNASTKAIQLSKRSAEVLLIAFRIAD